MAAPAMTRTFLGALDADTGTWAKDNALFLKVFSGEVLTAFDEVNVMKDLHIVRNINSGKQASFPATWKTSAAYHVPGNMIIGDQSVLLNERIISIDDFLLSDIFIARIDELKKHFDVRGEFAKQMGAALARAFDKKTLQVAILAARAAATVSGGYGGSQISDADNDTVAATLAASLYTAAQTFDEKDIPEGDRYCVIKPAQYYLLLAVDKLLSKDYGQQNGDYAKGKVQTAAGITLVKSNNVPSTNIAAAVAGENNTYFGDFSKSIAAVFHRSAIGTIKRMDVTTSMTAEGGDYDTMYNGTLMTAKMLVGHGILRPESAIEIKVA
jgi:hypothetical protein